MPTPANFRDVVAKATGFLSDGTASTEKTVVKPSNLKRLYTILVLLSSKDKNYRFDFSSTSNPREAELEIAGLNLKFGDINSLSHNLYKELVSRFDDLVSALSDAREGECQSINGRASEFEVMILLLRCCMVMLPLMEYDKRLIMENGAILLFILRRLFSVEFGGAGFVDFRSCTDSSSKSKPLLVPCTFVCAMLEAFADEILIHRSLAKYLMRIDSSTSGCETLFKVRDVYLDIGTVLDLICAHFIVSGFHEPPFKHLSQRLVCFHQNNVRTSEICMSAALSLLLNPIISSAPKMFQAYSVLLASETSGISEPAFENYFAAFERSVILYARCVPSLCVDGYHFCASGLQEEEPIKPRHQLDFNSFLQAGTQDKLYHLISKLNNSWALSMSNASLEADYVAYVKESLYIFEDSHRNEVLSILTCIIQRCSSDASDDSLCLSKEEACPEDIFYLASMLKLMSSSLLQAIRVLGDSCRDSMLKIAGRFQEFSISLPLQKYLQEMMGSELEKHQESKFMILHFSGLLFFSYSRKLDFLVKNCLLMIMASLSFLIFQEGSLDALRFAIGSTLQPSLSESPTIQEPTAFGSNSKRIAFNFRKIQETYFRTSVHSKKKRSVDITVSSDASEEEEEEKEEEEEEDCNGEAFFECVYGGEKKASSKYEDLMDFVVCTEGRDYNSWFSVRKRFTAWKHRKAKGIRTKRRNMILGNFASKQRRTVT